MKRTEIHTEKAPKAIGPYVQAIKAGKLVFTSGQLGIDPETGNMLEGVEAQAHQMMKNLREILKEAGLSMDDVVKANLYLTDINDFAQVNDIYAGYFDRAFPARATVQVSGLAKGGLVEVDAIAVKQE